MSREQRVKKAGSPAAANREIGVAGKHAVTMLVQLHDNYRR